MLTLAVDTTGAFGSIAVADETGTREEVLLHAPDGFSGILFAEIGALLKRQGLQLADIGLFAGASGPGSFTGVRIGLAAMKGLGEVMGKPVAAVSNLEAVAQWGKGELRAAVIDARRGEVFAALFDSAGNEVIEEIVTPLQRFVECLGDRDFEWVTSEPDWLRGALAGTRSEQMPVAIAPRALAGTVARLACRRGGTDPLRIEANYVRRSDAELLWKG